MTHQRSYEESCQLLDRIVGRCVRDADFAAAVLADPAASLRDYQLRHDELADFTALRNGYHDEALAGWASIRAAMDTVSGER